MHRTAEIITSQKIWVNAVYYVILYTRWPVAWKTRKCWGNLTAVTEMSQNQKSCECRRKSLVMENCLLLWGNAIV